MRWSATALLVIASVGCSGGGEEPFPAPSTPASAVFPDPGTQHLDPVEAQALQDVLTKVVAFPDSPSGARGATAAIVTERWTWSGAAGTDVRGTALRPDTSLAVASITKTFVAAEVMLLANAGRINLDLPISRYVQHKLTANYATVRQHLSMTSGVSDFTSADISLLEEAVAAAPGRHWTAAEPLNYYSAAVTDPGSSFRYSNPSYVLLGLLIEKIAGQPLATVLRRDLAAPAGLQRAAFQDAEQPRPPVAHDNNKSCGAPDGYLPCRAFASATAAFGGLAADAPTVARWGYQLYGGRVLPADLVRQLTDGDGEYGLGTMRFSLVFGIGYAYGHSGDTPDHTSLLVVIPEKRVSIALLLTDGGRRISRPMSDLVQALGPLLG